MKKNLTKWLKTNYDYVFLVVIIFSVVLLKLCILGNELSTGIPLTNTLDFSWQIDNIERFLHGYIAGKDFIFTYGPLFQLIYSLPALLFKQPSFIAILYAPILVTIFNVFLLFFSIKLATNEKKFSIFLTFFLLFFVGLIGYDSNSLFRILLPFFYGMVLIRFYAIKNFITLKNLIILLLPALFGLYTFDLFIICFLTTFLFVGYELYLIYKNKKTKSKLKKYALFGFFHLILVCTFEIFTSLLLSGNLSYLLYSFDTVQNYQLVMGIPWSVNKYFLFLIFPLGLCLVLFHLIRLPKLQQNKKIAFITLTIIALLQLKSAFIRSDDSHILMGVYPSIIILCIVSIYIFHNKIRIFIIILFISVMFVFPWKNNYINTVSSHNLKESLSFASTDKSFFSLYHLSHDYYFTQKDFQLFKSFITKHPGNVMIYPYDSYILNIYGQTYNTHALQFYGYSDSLVEEKTVESFSKNPPKFIILGIDDQGALRLDNIPNFSRNPRIAKWMLTNYSVYTANKNYFILQFNPNKSTTASHQNCTVYDIDTRKISQPNIFERFVKPSTYYLNNVLMMRLPYTPHSQYLFILEGFNDSLSLQTLFESKLNFDTHQIIKKNDIKIIKKDFTKHLTTYTDLSVKCY